MLKKILKSKILFNLLKTICYKKKKNVFSLGPIGNYCYSICITKINKKYNFFFLKKIKDLKISKKILPYENNNGGIVRDTLNLLLKKKIFIKKILILNIEHNFFCLKKKKIFYLHNQSYKQIKKKLIFLLKKIKTKIINSNSEINNGLNICNFLTKKTVPINIKNLQLKDNIYNKTKFIVNSYTNKKNKIISFFSKKLKYDLDLSSVLTIYKNKQIYYFEIFLKSLKILLFLMKQLKKKNKILISGFYNIL
ncbi:prephenate dehydratase domain-containing protein [Candidatus Carsonella ruddii]|uniref:prephenate dehydratase domain-containing protein n=1 Tax=Carsonella ruddii TaxID=114186 RepID=UPI003D815890